MLWNAALTWKCEQEIEGRRTRRTISMCLFLSSLQPPPAWVNPPGLVCLIRPLQDKVSCLSEVPDITHQPQGCILLTRPSSPIRFLFLASWLPWTCGLRLMNLHSGNVVDQYLILIWEVQSMWDVLPHKCMYMCTFFSLIVWLPAKAASGDDTETAFLCVCFHYMRLII